MRFYLMVSSCIGLGISCLITALMFGGFLTNDGHRAIVRTSPLLLSIVSSDDLHILALAEQDLITSCMHGKGFGYWPDVPETSRYLQPLTFAPPSIAMARRHGFGAASLPTRNNEYIESLPSSRSAAYSQALTGLGIPGTQVIVKLQGGAVMGHSAEGCQASAENQLYGNFQNWYAASIAVGEIQSSLQSEVGTSARWAAAIRRWRACAAAKGFHWVSLAQADTDPASPHANNAAIADAQCGLAAHLTVIAKAIGASDSSLLLARYQKEVRAYRLMQERAIPKANQVVRACATNINR